jgi:long-chain acyl-CoA synthetase
VRAPVIPGGGPQSVSDVLVRGLAADPRAEAIVSRHSRLSYAELDASAAAAAGMLAGLGVASGDRVAASTGNHAELVVAFLGAMRVGAIWVGVNRSAASDEVAFVLRDAQAAVFLGEPDAVARLPAKHEVPDLRTVVTMDAGDPSCDWQVRLGGAEPIAPRDVDAFAPAALAYTSGTTGRPKGVVHSQHNLLVPGAVINSRSGHPSARPGVCLPLTILNLMILGPLTAFQAAECCVLMDRVDAVGIADWVQRERVTTFSAVPAMVYDLLTNPEVDQDALESLVEPGVGGADCPQALRDLYRQRFGVRITSGYGLTEAPTVVTREDPSTPPVAGSAGRPLPHVAVTVRDPEGAVLATGQVGEICVAAAPDGPFAGVYTPMLGYWNRPEAAAEAFFPGGVLRTGDLGHLDADGNLFVTDRKGDLIIRGGANVYPAEVERVLAGIPGVAACAVVGLPDARLGERVAAAVVLEPGSGATEASIRERCGESLARYKIPERVVVVDALPRNAMGKVLRRQVLALF